MKGRSQMKLDRLLVANRGEIAIRIARAAKDYGISAVGLVSASEDPTLLNQHFDKVVALPGDGVAAYLDQDALIALARTHAAGAIHPGYGFLSENADFAQRVVDEGLMWIGPPAAAIRKLGNKVVARRLANELPGMESPLLALGEEGLVQAQEFIQEHGLPVVFKAVDGGGGRGMRVVRDLGTLKDGYEAAKAEAKRSFGSDRLLLERFVEGAHHVELQVLADSDGGLAFVGTRDCSVQRRYQKLIEEAPAPGVSAAMVQKMCEIASHLCREAGYVGAGTFEFLIGAGGELLFLEVNTRLQVEHTVTEETSGRDLVVEQFKIAEGGHVPESDVLSSHGHAIEFRINADDVANDFLPATGTISRLRLPCGPGVRVDAGIAEGSVVGPQFDSLLMKLIIYGPDRRAVLARARRALGELEIEGVTTNLGVFRFIVDDPLFVADNGVAIDTGWLERAVLGSLPKAGSRSLDRPFMVGEQRFWASHTLGFEKVSRLGAPTQESRPVDAGGEVTVAAPMQAVVTRVLVAPGDKVVAGAPLFALEAMKMENLVLSPRDATVGVIHIASGDNVRRGTPCVLLVTGSVGGQEH